MRTIKPFNVDEMRVKASQKNTLHLRVPFYITGTTTQKDTANTRMGLIVGFTVWYRDMLVRVEEYTHQPSTRRWNTSIQFPKSAWAS